MLFVFVFVINSLLVGYCACSLSLSTIAFEEIIYQNVDCKTSLNDILINLGKGRKQFFTRVASIASHLFLRIMLHNSNRIGLC